MFSLKNKTWNRGILVIVDATKVHGDLLAGGVDLLGPLAAGPLPGADGLLVDIQSNGTGHFDRHVEGDISQRLEEGLVRVAELCLDEMLALLQLQNILKADN